MAKRLNYGPRFGSSAITNGYGYDAAVHKGMVPAGFLNADHHRAGIKGATSNAAKQSTAYLGKPIEEDEREQAEMRLITRISQCVDVLAFGLSELMTTPPSRRATRQSLLNQSQVIDFINHMCKMIGRELPEYNIYRRPGIAQVLRCIDCGTELIYPEKERCPVCRDSKIEHKQVIMQEARDIIDERKRKRRELAHTKMEMQKMLRKIKEARREGHRRHTSEDAAIMERGGRGEDQCGGGPAAHWDSASDFRHTQGGDDGVASQPDAHPTGAGEAENSSETSS
jgi:hypothetical protein